MSLFNNNRIVNFNMRFLGANPPVHFNRCSCFPDVTPCSYVSTYSTIVGDVTVKESCFIAPQVSIRADEGHKFFIGRESNVQEGCIFHGFKKENIEHDGCKFSIFVGERVSCNYECVLQGPCEIGDDTFIGSQVIISEALVGDGCFISSKALICGVILKPNSFVPIGAVINTSEAAAHLRPVNEEEREFARERIRVNRDLAQAYLNGSGKKEFRGFR